MYGQQYRYQDMVQSYISTLLIMILREWQKNGFADCSHFIKAFKQKHGITPKQYRKERISSSTQTSIVK